MKKVHIPYGRQCLDERDIQAVCEVLRSDWLTTGPAVSAFEQAFTEFVSCTHGIAVSSGTAALHCAMYAIGIGPGDEVIVPAITFAATANAVVYQGATPIFADVDPDTLLIDVRQVESLITSRTKAVIAVDYAGQPCDYHGLRDLTDRHGLALLADACHALGAEYHGKKTGSLADITLFSFHPVKHITTGEGGMAVTANDDYARRMKRFRNHGISTDFREREEKNSWYYEMQDLGFNYRLSDIQCALGISQLSRLPEFLKRRREIAGQYEYLFKDNSDIIPLSVNTKCLHAYHLYVVKLPGSAAGRDEVFRFMREQGIGVNLHYIPVYLHPFYQSTFGYGQGLCPRSEEAYKQILSLPIWPGMTDQNILTVHNTLQEALVEKVKR